MNEYDAAFAAASGVSANPYDAIMAQVLPKQRQQPAPQMDVAPKDGPVDAALIAAGRTFDRLGAGVQQLYYGAKGDDQALSSLKAEQDERTRLFQPLAKERPFSTAVGSSLPYMAVPVGGATAGVGSLMLRSGLAGAVPEALSYGTTQERLQNAGMAGLGGATGAGLGYAVGKGVNAIGHGLRVNPQSQAAAAVLEKNGVPVRPDQATGNRVLQNINSALDNLPFTAGKQQTFREGQQQAFNQAVGGRAAIVGTELDDAARLAAKRDIGNRFTQLASRNTVSPQATNQLVVDLAAIQGDAARMGTSDTGRIVSNAIDDVLSKVQANGTMEGQAYRQLDSALGKVARNNKSGDVANYIGEVRNALRTAMDSSISTADQKAWQSARQQYANLANISRSVNESGDVSARTLYNNLRNSSRDITKTAKGDLGELSSAARRLIPDAIPNSGTAQRAMYQALLTGGGGVAGYVGSGGDVEKAALGAAGAFGLPMLVQAAINNPKAVGLLTRQLYSIPGAGPVGGLLGASAGYAAPSLVFPASAP